MDYSSYGSGGGGGAGRGRGRGMRMGDRGGMRSGGGMPFDGKRMRKAVKRPTVDYISPVIRNIEDRVRRRDYRDLRFLQPDISYYVHMLPPAAYPHNPASSIATKWFSTSTNKVRCPVFTLKWTPEGRRLVTGASSGEFTLWNGCTFNFETILQAHESSVRHMVWSHNKNWMVTTDDSGYVMYWQSNMNKIAAFQAHKDPVRQVTMSPTDKKLATCSDDGSVKVFDFLRLTEERTMRGHGADVKCVDWHPQKGLLVSGSRDAQQPMRLWDPKSGKALSTLHLHKNTVTDLSWNANGNWLLSASRDKLIKIFELRMMKELQVFRGHQREVTALRWHPIYEDLFVSGGHDGSINFWLVGQEKQVGSMARAHESAVWSLDWHPMGHVLASGSNDHTTKFWTRNRPGDQLDDKYNLPDGQGDGHGRSYGGYQSRQGPPGAGRPHGSYGHRPGGGGGYGGGGRGGHYSGGGGGGYGGRGGRGSHHGHRGPPPSGAFGGR